MTFTPAVELSLSSTECEDHSKRKQMQTALVLINFTNPKLVYAHLSQEEANALNISQPLSLPRKSGER